MYLEVNDAHKKYTAPYEVYITLQPHAEEKQTFRYAKIEEYFGEEEYLCVFMIKEKKGNPVRSPFFDSDNNRKSRFRVTILCYNYQPYTAIVYLQNRYTRSCSCKIQTNVLY